MKYSKINRTFLANFGVASPIGIGVFATVEYLFCLAGVHIPTMQKPSNTEVDLLKIRKR